MRRIILFHITLTTLSGLLLAQNRNIPVEPSERWLNEQHQPEKLMDAIGLKEGMTIADIGAGRGRLSVWFADRVGETGMVYANDIDSRALDYLEERCRKNNIMNIKAFMGKVDDPKLPEGKADIAIIVSAYHHFDKPADILRNTIPCLKKDGILVVVERDPLKTGQTSRESTSREKMIRETKEAGLELIKINSELLERDNIYFFRSIK